MNKYAASAVRTGASFFGCGYVPWASGTVGSAAGLAMAWYWPDLRLPLAIATALIGFALARPAVKAFGNADPQRFVIDEVAGQILAVLVVPVEPLPFIAGFILFRTFDTIKPWPIILIQRRGTPSSIMWDDLAAGAVSLALVQGAVLCGWM